MSKLERPHKFRVLLDLKRGEIDAYLASKLLDTTEKATQQMLTVWSPHLHKLVPLVDKLMQVPETKAEQMKTKERLAKIIGVTARQVNRTLQRAGIEVPTTQKAFYRQEAHKNFAKRKRGYQQHALSAIAGIDTAENVASDAGISKRQMYRVIHSLCDLGGLHYKDLEPLDLGKRRRIALQIEHLLDGKDESK